MSSKKFNTTVAEAMDWERVKIKDLDPKWNQPLAETRAGRAPVDEVWMNRNDIPVPYFYPDTLWADCFIFVEYMEKEMKMVMNIDWLPAMRHSDGVYSDGRTVSFGIGDPVELEDNLLLPRQICEAGLNALGIEVEA